MGISWGEYISTTSAHVNWCSLNPKLLHGIYWPIKISGWNTPDLFGSIKRKYFSTFFSNDYAPTTFSCLS